MTDDERLIASAKYMLRFFRDRKWDTFSRRDAWQLLRGNKRYQNGNFELVLNYLVGRGSLRMVETKRNGTTGRKPVPLYVFLGDMKRLSTVTR